MNYGAITGALAGVLYTAVHFAQHTLWDVPIIFLVPGLALVPILAGVAFGMLASTYGAERTTSHSTQGAGVLGDRRWGTEH